MHSRARPWLVRNPKGGAARRLPKQAKLEDNTFAEFVSRYVIHDFCFVHHCQSLHPTAAYFEIHEQQEDGSLRLQLTGELDLVSVSVLENRLGQLRAEQQSVRLDLSRLEFMDSAGIQLLISAIKHGREDGWRFEVDPGLSPQVKELFKLTKLEYFTAPQLQRSFARQALRS